MGSLTGGSSASSRPSGIPGSSTGPTHTSSTGTQFGRPADGPQLGQSTQRPWEIGPWTIRLFVLVFIGAYTAVFMAEEQRRLDDPVLKAERGEVTPTSPESMIRNKNLRRALSTIRRESPRGATVESLRIEPGRVQATVAQSDGAQRQLEVDLSGEVSTREASADEPEGLAFSRIPVEVPERLLRTIEGKLKLRPADLDYILLNPRKQTIGSGRDDSWGVYYSKPPLNNDATAELNGKDVRLLGTPKAAQRAQMRRAAEASLRSLEDSERRIRSANFPNEAMREQSLQTIRAAKERARETLKDLP